MSVRNVCMYQSTLLTSLNAPWLRQHHWQTASATFPVPRFSAEFPRWRHSETPPDVRSFLILNNFTAFTSDHKMLGKARGRKRLQMLSDISCKSYESLKMESGRDARIPFLISASYLYPLKTIHTHILSIQTLITAICILSVSVVLLRHNYTTSQKIFLQVMSVMFFDSQCMSTCIVLNTPWHDVTRLTTDSS